MSCRCFHLQSIKHHERLKGYIQLPLAATPRQNQYVCPAYHRKLNLGRTLVNYQPICRWLPFVLPVITSTLHNVFSSIQLLY